MTAQTFPGFLLTRNWRDTRDGVELEFWFATDRGALCARVHGERSVFFLAEAELARARELLDGAPGVEIRSVALRNFDMAPVVAVYCHSYRQARRWADQLRERGLDPLEADINPADRFKFRTPTLRNVALTAPYGHSGSYDTLEAVEHETVVIHHGSEVPLVPATRSSPSLRPRRRHSSCARQGSHT